MGPSFPSRLLSAKIRFGAGSECGGCAIATKAYVFIETAVGKTREVAAALRSLKEVRSADIVTGPYDIITIIEGGDDLGSIGDMVTGRVHTIAGITRSVTCLSVDNSS